jgi:cell division protease FtsH
VAGEANVPFFSLSGSEFVEMFVGVGAARVRDLFEQAKQRAPCIVFIDELDAIGKSRAGVAALATHDEREQTLNQLLVEMDGFAAGSGVVIMAATNRPEVLDAALLRAGRFDRQVLVEQPDVEGREAILVVHARRVKLSPNVNLRVVARRTIGMVGADLANVVNEAALAATRRGAKMVEQQDFEEAIDRIQLGLKKHGRALGEEEKRRVAFHESGHALVALSVAKADPVHRVTIIPRSIGALGATLQLPTEDRYLITSTELEDRLAVMMGGRTAEELVFGDVSTGASNDLERATETARQMVCRFGMSEALGPLTYGASHGMRFLQGAIGMGEERNYSEKTAQLIDAEVQRIVQEQLARAREILSRRRAMLQAIAAELMVKETLERGQLEEIVRGVPAALTEVKEAPASPVAAASGMDGVAIGHA